MGVQLIFVVEANKSCKSDWIYIKSTIDYFYEYNRTGLKLSPVYMDGKGNYKQKEKEVKSLISQYSKASKGNKSKVATVYKGNIIKNLIMDCQSYTKYRANETTGGIFVSWRRKEELPPQQVN